MRRWIVSGACLLGIAGAVGVGCTSKGGSGAGTVPAQSGIISVAFTAGSVAALPSCTAALSGTTASVSSPPGLWLCTKHGNRFEWQSIACTADLGGTVAYESDTQELWACVGAQWTPVSL